MAWSYRKPLTINSALTPGALTNFPLLVSFASDTDLAAKAQADGDDIAFFDSDETTQLDHEIESYSSGTLIAHIRKPSLPATGDPIIYMYYGDAALGSQQNVAGVWANSYEGVWHLGESPGATAPQFIDSTGNGYNGTANGTTVTSVAGQVGNGVRLAGVNENISIPGIMTALDAAAELTISMWLRPDNATARVTAMGHGNSFNNPGEGFVISYRGDLAGDPLDFEFNSANTGVGLNARINVGNLSDAPHYIVYVIDRDGLLTLFKDGTSVGTFDISAKAGASINSSGNPLELGRRGEATATTLPWLGLLDEISIATTARTPNWITTEYNNQNAPSAFITVGTEEFLLGNAAAAVGFYHRLMG